MRDEWYEALRGELTGWLCAVTGDRALAEDLVQETFLRALLHGELLAGLNAHQRRAWLYRTAKNLRVDKCRHDSFETVMDELPEQTTEHTDYAWVDSKQLLSVLDEEERVLFVLRYLEGYNATELGKLFQLPPGTIRSKLSDARHRLKHLLGG